MVREHGFQANAKVPAAWVRCVMTLSVSAGFDTSSNPLECPVCWGFCQCDSNRREGLGSRGSAQAIEEAVRARISQTASTGLQHHRAYFPSKLAVCRQQRRAMLTRWTRGGNARRLRLRTLPSLKRTMTATTRQAHVCACLCSVVEEAANMSGVPQWKKICRV